MKKFFLAQDSYSFYLPEECTPMVVNKDLTMKRISTQDTPDIIFHNIDNYTSSNESVDFNVYVTPDNTNICFYSMTHDYVEKLEDGKPMEFNCMFVFTSEITKEQAETAMSISKKEIIDFYEEKEANYVFTFDYQILENDNDFTEVEVQKELEKNWRIQLSNNNTEFILLDQDENEDKIIGEPQRQPKVLNIEVDIEEDEIPF